MIPKILKVTEPCTENWEQMTPNEKGRFCDSCQKTVIDFTEMTPSEISEFLKDHNGSFCGRIKGKSQLYSAFNKEKVETGNYFPFPGRSIAATAMLTTGLVFMTPISNNVEIPSIENIQLLNQSKKNSDKKQLVPVDNDEVIIKGNITPNSDKYKNIGIANAKVSLLTKEKEYYTYTDSNGDFELLVPKDVVKDKNVIYFSYGKVSNSSYFEKIEKEYSFHGFESNYIILAKNHINNSITEKANLIFPMLGGIGAYETTYLVNGQILSENQMMEIWKTKSQDKSCNINTTETYFLYREAASIVAGQEIEGDLIVQYDSTENLEDISVF